MSVRTGEEKRVVAAADATAAASATAGDGARNEDGSATMKAASMRRRSHAGTLLHDVRLVLVAVWLGAAVFFSFAVAPSAFAVLPSRELAGAIVGRTLSIVNAGGFIISLLLLASMMFSRRAVNGRRRLLAELVSLVLIASATGVGQWVIAARLQALRAAMGRPIDELAQHDPLRVGFGSLHGYSVLALSVAMLAAVVALLLIARRVRPPINDALRKTD